MARRRACFIYASGSWFSGQKAATEMLMKELQARGWHCSSITVPALRRLPGLLRLWGLILFVLETLAGWVRVLWLLRRKQAVYLNLGQSWISFIRDGVPFLILSAVAERGRRSIALHGNVFMMWRPQQRITKAFLMLVRFADSVVVLGPRQFEHLAALGVPRSKLGIVLNSCTIDPVGEAQVLDKHRNIDPLRILFLSTLLPSKGYPEYVEALEQISKAPDAPVIDAILCGPFRAGPFEDRFADLTEAEEWVREKLSVINSSQSVRLSHVNGVFAEEKEKLFRGAHIFVLPSRYPVEAQPLVVLEAFASGCAVVTSAAGEIPYTVGSAAVVLDDVTPETVGNAILALARDSERRSALAMRGLSEFQSRFSLATHVDAWEKILQAQRA